MSRFLGLSYVKALAPVGLSRYNVAMYSAVAFIIAGLLLILIASIFGYALGLLFRVLLIIGVLAVIYGAYRFKFRR
jgi:hypothetical protein